MPLTHDFKETIRARAQRDPAFRQALLRESVECILSGDLDTGKSVLRDYVNATVGFQDLEKRTQIPAKSLMRMLGPKGSPSLANLSSILTALQKTERVHFELALRRSFKSRVPGRPRAAATTVDPNDAKKNPLASLPSKRPLMCRR